MRSKEKFLGKYFVFSTKYNIIQQSSNASVLDFMSVISCQSILDAHAIYSYCLGSRLLYLLFTFFRSSTKMCFEILQFYLELFDDYANYRQLLSEEQYA